MNFWDAVSKRFAGNKYVIGYDPLNEPEPTTLYSDPELMLEPGRFDEHILSPLMANVWKKTVKNDDSQLVFFEGTQHSDTIGGGNGLILPAGYETVPGGKGTESTQVFNEHTYCC